MEQLDTEDDITNHKYKANSSYMELKQPPNGEPSPNIFSCLFIENKFDWKLESYYRYLLFRFLLSTLVISLIK